MALQNRKQIFFFQLGKFWNTAVIWGTIPACFEVKGIRRLGARSLGTSWKKVVGTEDKKKFIGR
jgi:hypothetical protein